MKKNQNTVCLKKLLVKTTIVFTSIIFSYTVRFLVDLINQYHSLFATKFIDMLKVFYKTSRFSLVKIRRYLACTRGVKAMLETPPPPEC